MDVRLQPVTWSLGIAQPTPRINKRGKQGSVGWPGKHLLRFRALLHADTPTTAADEFVYVVLDLGGRLEFLARLATRESCCHPGLVPGVVVLRWPALVMNTSRSAHNSPITHAVRLFTHAPCAVGGLAASSIGANKSQLLSPPEVPGTRRQNNVHAFRIESCRYPARKLHFRPGGTAAHHPCMCINILPTGGPMLRVSRLESCRTPARLFDFRRLPEPASRLTFRTQCHLYLTVYAF